jgi:hypothetical protein
MAWTCRMVDTPTGAKPGDMWFGGEGLVHGPHAGYYLEHYLSAEYKRDWLGKRLPLFVCLPSGDHFCVDSVADGAGEGGWTVTGEPPTITVSPSINAPGRYHGWLRDGVLSDDVEGRSYP